MKTLIFIIGIYANEPYSVFLDIHTLLSKVPFCLSRVPVATSYLVALIISNRMFGKL